MRSSSGCRQIRLRLGTAPSALRLGVRPSTHDSIPAWPTGRMGLVKRVTEDNALAVAHPTGEDLLDVDDVGLGRFVSLSQLFLEPVDQERGMVKTGTEHENV